MRIKLCELIICMRELLRKPGKEKRGIQRVTELNHTSKREAKRIRNKKEDRN